MRNFKKVLLMLLALFLVEQAAVFGLEPVTYTYYLEKDLTDLKWQGKEPDVVLVGDSRIYRSFVPKIMDEKLGDGAHCTLNTGTGSQSIQESYYYLKDLMKSYPVKYAVVELTYTCFLQTEEESVMGKTVVLDRMQGMGSKLEYIGQIMDMDEWPYVLKSYRYRNYVSDIPENIKTKLNADTRKGIDTRESERYEDRGFVWTSSGFEDGAVGMPSPEPVQWENEKVSSEAFEWLDKIHGLCLENDVELILVTGPTTLSTIYSVENYGDSYQRFTEYAAKHKIPYFELNLLRDRTYLLPDSMMRDSDHVCGAGAEVTTEIFCDILNAYFAGKDTSKWFYASVDEMKKDINAVVACDFKTEEKEGSQDRTIKARSLHENGKSVEYEFWINRNPGKGNWELLQEYGKEDTCPLSARELERDIEIRVNARLQGSTAEWESHMVRLKEVGQ